jgi:hypothetical protein
MTHELSKDVLLLCQNGEDGSFMSSCINLVVQELDDDDEFLVYFLVVIMPIVGDKFMVDLESELE